MPFGGLSYFAPNVHAYSLSRFINLKQSADCLLKFAIIEQMYYCEYDRSEKMVL